MTQYVKCPAERCEHCKHRKYMRVNADEYDWDCEVDGCLTKGEYAVEEASEFILAAQKYKRFPNEAERITNLVEETGDLLICVEQIRLYLGSIAVDDSIDFKLTRERRRIREMKEGAE